MLCICSGGPDTQWDIASAAHPYLGLWESGQNWKSLAVCRRVFHSAFYLHRYNWSLLGWPALSLPGPGPTGVLQAGFQRDQREDRVQYPGFTPWEAESVRRAQPDPGWHEGQEVGDLSLQGCPHP